MAMNIIKTIVRVVAHLFPSPIKILLLKIAGYKIGQNTYIGYSIISGEQVEIGSNVSIGHFNLMRNLKTLKLKNGSRVGSFNWITGGGSGGLSMGLNASIRRFHFIEASGGVFIGNNSILAGRGSHLFTHGLSPSNLDDVRSINILDWCYIGSSVRIVPGVTIAEGNFVGMGSVVTKEFSEGYKLIAGNPAIIKKSLKKTDVYFSRPFLLHGHHPKSYNGGEEC